MGKVHLATAPVYCLSGCTCRLPQRIRPNILAFGGLADGFLPFDTAPGQPKVELHLASVVMKAVQARVHGGQQHGCMPCSGKVGDDTNAAKAQVDRCLNCVHVPAPDPQQVSRPTASLLVTAIFHWRSVAFRSAPAKLMRTSLGLGGPTFGRFTPKKGEGPNGCNVREHRHCQHCSFRCVGSNVS